MKLTVELYPSHWLGVVKRFILGSIKAYTVCPITGHRPAMSFKGGAPYGVRFCVACYKWIEISSCDCEPHSYLCLSGECGNNFKMYSLKGFKRFY